MKSRSDKSIRSREGNKSLMRPFSKLLWSLVYIQLIVSIIAIFFGINLLPTLA